MSSEVLEATPPGSFLGQVNPELGDYYQQSRQEMLGFLPPDPKRLIDIGCGEGLFGAAVKARFPTCETWGVELVPDAAERAATRNDHVLRTSFEQPVELPAAYFDVVTMNDVLEHMTWPEPALANVKRILRPGGKLVLSLPNVQYYLNVRDLVLKNDWEYRDRGVLDRTHFRFFTSRSATRLLQQNGFQVEQIVGINPSRLKPHYRALFAMAPRLFRWMRFPQFAVVARPIT
jgi:2-polyprenyl-3-methyl-5-hydroxy-6-metoxy-1,4-benzoquinol methylase